MSTLSAFAFSFPGYFICGVIVALAFLAFMLWDEKNTPVQMKIDLEALRNDPVFCHHFGAGPIDASNPFDLVMFTILSVFIWPLVAFLMCITGVCVPGILLVQKLQRAIA